MEHVIFHLAFPVRDLEEALRFYADVLGCGLGRKSEQWCDVYLFGHQLTLHHQPDDVLNPEQQGVRHFGAVLKWRDWENYADRLREKHTAFEMPPTVSHPGTDRERARLFLRDPSGNGIEIKTYKNLEKALQLPKNTFVRYI